MLDWSGAPLLRGTKLFLDSREPRELGFVSHAHSDHIAAHGLTFCTDATASLLAHRLGAAPVARLGYDVAHPLDATTILRALPAGHVLGSAMLHATTPEGSLLYTGDFKLQSALTAEPARPEPADALLMECTYGQPFFRLPPRRQVVEQLVDLVEEAFRAGRQPVVMGYSLGKGQEITRLLTDAGFPVTCHGAVAGVNDIYQQHGVTLGRYRRYAYADFHGPNAIDLRCRGVLVAPPSCARTAFVTRFKNPLSLVLTGWGLLPNAKYRYGVDHVLPLSDHADFDELLQLVERVHPRRVYTQHGPREFADHLRKRGWDAAPVEPEAQLSLFPD